MKLQGELVTNDFNLKQHIKDKEPSTQGILEICVSLMYLHKLLASKTRINGIAKIQTLDQFY